MYREKSDSRPVSYTHLDVYKRQAIPITLIYANGFEKSTYVFEVTGPIKWVIGILMIIWLVGTIIFTIRFLKKYRAIRKDILNADLCGEEIQSMVKSISKKLGVHKEKMCIRDSSR